MRDAASHQSRLRPRVTPEALMAAMKKKKKSAPGTDGWRPAHLARLPYRWFCKLSDLINAVIDRRLKLPEAWTNVNVVLIPRPISIAAAIWRAAGTALVAQTARWIAYILPTEIAGGTPGRDADDILSEFDAALQAAIDGQGQLFGASIDLSKCFDREELEIALIAMQSLGMCEHVVDYIRRFYADNITWFKGRATMPPDALKRLRGLLQGCPLSMLLLAITMGGYARELTRQFPSVEKGIFVDDRLCWSNQKQQLAGAIKLSKEIDGLCCRVWNVGKGLTFTTSESREDREWCTKELAADCGELKDELVYLGAEFAVSGQDKGIEDFSVVPKREDKILLRLTRIRKASRDQVMRRKVLLSWSRRASDLRLSGGATRGCRPSRLV